MADRNPARLAAPLALLAAVVAVAVVVKASGSDAPSSLGPSARPAVTQPARTRTSRAVPHAYVVKPGDTLSVIADKTGVPLETIQRLNPDVDPNALQSGQRLVLSP